MSYEEVRASATHKAVGYITSISKAVSWVSVDGSVPVNRLLLIANSVSEVQPPISEGSVPLNIFDAIPLQVIVRRPCSGKHVSSVGHK